MSTSAERQRLEGEYERLNCLREEEVISAHPDWEELERAHIAWQDYNKRPEANALDDARDPDASSNSECVQGGHRTKLIKQPRRTKLPNFSTCLLNRFLVLLLVSRLAGKRQSLGSDAGYRR